MYFSNTNLIKSVVLNNKQSRGAREVCYSFFMANASSRTEGGDGTPCTFTYYGCDDYSAPITTTISGNRFANENTSSVDTPQCVSGVRPIVVSPESSSLNNPNQYFFSPFSCYPETEITASTDYEYVTFLPFAQQITIPYCLASYIPSGSTTYEYRLLYSGSTLGPIAIASGSAYYSPGAAYPQGNAQTLPHISYSVYP